MIEVLSNLFIGNQIDYETKVKNNNDWYIVHACKEPYHRQVLGYTGRGAPKDHPEYLFARRGNRLILNLVDVDDSKYIAKEIIDASINFIREGLQLKKKVLVHCNQGESRAPSIGLLYLVLHYKIANISLEEAEDQFKDIYPNYNPRKGIRGFLKQNWYLYLSGKEKSK